MSERECELASNNTVTNTSINSTTTSTRRIRVSTRSNASTSTNSTNINDPQMFIIKHFTDAFKRIIDIFQDSKLCDVTFICKDDFRIKAHRIILSSVSDYFRAMFTSNLSEAFKDEIEMSTMDGIALKSLIDFIYTGTIDLNDSNIFSILNAASFLQIGSVIKLGSEYLMNNLNFLNCINIYRYSQDQSLLDLKKTSFKYILENFEQIIQNNELLIDLTHLELINLFQSSLLNVSSEEIVFDTLIKWIESNKETLINDSDPSMSDDVLFHLLSKVKLPLLKPLYLSQQIESNNFISNNLKCQNLMLEASTYHLNGDKFKVSPIERTNPRKSTIGYLFAIGGNDKKVCQSMHSLNSNFIEKYDFRLEKWIALNLNQQNDYIKNNKDHIPPTLNACTRRQFATAFLDHKLYIVGGRDGPKSLSTVECYDLITDTWTLCPRMITNRHGLQTAFINNEPILYAIGGHDSWAFLNSVERYDLQSESWLHVTPMNNARSLFGIANIENDLYVVGGRDHTSSLNSIEYFNPLKNKWKSCANMIKRRCSVAVTAINGFIIAIGGHEAISSTRYECGERYDPKTDQWTMISNISRPREAIAVCNLGSAFVYIAGGYDGHKYVSDCERYDLNTNEWVKIKPLNFSRAGASLIHVPNLMSDSKKCANSSVISITNKTIIDTDES